MTKRTPELLRECLASGNVEAWLAEHPEHRNELVPYLQMHSILWGARPPEPSAEGEREGRQRLMTAVAQPEGQTRSGRVGWLPAPFMKLATVAAALALFLMAAAGASAALGGGDFVDDVLTTLHVPNPVSDGGINNAPEAADNGREHANPNAFQGAGNASDGINNASPNATNGLDQANPNALQGSGNADDGINNASPNATNGLDHANPNAFQGSGNASEGSGNAGPNASQQTPPEQSRPPGPPQ